MKLCGICLASPVDRDGMCFQCQRAYRVGRAAALREVIACCERVRGSARRGKENEPSIDEYGDGSYCASSAILSFVRKLAKRKKAK